MQEAVREGDSLQKEVEDFKKRMKKSEGLLRSNKKLIKDIQTSITTALETGKEMVVNGDVSHHNQSRTRSGH